jgi:hypothetical protein
MQREAELMADGFLKDYEPVEDRLRDFWSENPDGRVLTTLVRAEDGDYIFRADVWRNGMGYARVDTGTGSWVHGSIDPDVTPPPDATGYAHDSTASLPNNMKASALEVCETSAIGRALANLGYAAKGKRPSREEMQKSAEIEPVTGVSQGSARVDGKVEADGGAPAPPKHEEPALAYGEGASEGAGEGGPVRPAQAEDAETPSLAITEAEQRKEFRAYLAETYGTAQALLMARELFQTKARAVKNMTVLSLAELQEIDTEFKARQAAVAS